MTTLTPAPPRTRLGYIDNLRILLTVLVLVHHTALTYGALPLWYWTEPSTGPGGVALMLLVITNQFFFMGFFFLISGLFVAGSVDRKGAGSFARDRLVRLGVPLAAFLLLARPVLALPRWPEHRAAGESFLTFWFTVGDAGPLWFVEVLLVMSLAYAAVRAVRGRSGGSPVVVTPQEAAPVRFRGIAALVGLLTVLTFLWRLLVPAGTYWEFGGLPSPAYLPQYVVLFVVGVLASRRGWLAGLSRRQGRVALVVAVLSVGLALGGTALGTAPGAGLGAQAVAALTENVFAVSAIVGLLVLFRERLSGTPAWARWAAQGSFTVYLIHALVLVGVAVLLAPLAAPALVKFLLLLVIAVPLCWVLAGLLRGIPGAKRVL